VRAVLVGDANFARKKKRSSAKKALAKRRSRGGGIEPGSKGGGGKNLVGGKGPVNYKWEAMSDMKREFSVLGHGGRGTHGKGGTCFLRKRTVFSRRDNRYGETPLVGGRGGHLGRKKLPTRVNRKLMICVRKGKVMVGRGR